MLEGSILGWTMFVPKQPKVQPDRQRSDNAQKAT